MRPPRIEKAAPCVRGDGPQNVDQLARHIDHIDSTTTVALQVARLTQRYRVPPVRAAVIAELAFGGGAR